MIAVFRQMRRAPVRVAASVMAIALAIAAIGVFAVPGVGSQTLESIAAEDNLTHLSATTTPFDELPSSIGDLSDVAAIEARSVVVVPLADDELDEIVVIGQPADATINTWRVESGRFPAAAGEVLVSDDAAAATGLVPGDVFDIGATAVTVTGIGDTTWFASSDAIVALPETAEAITGQAGFNRVYAQFTDPSSEALDARVHELRSILADADITYTTFPELLPDGAHPIEEDLTQVSFMIGSLGVVAGIVALVLLASTASAVVTERSRDAAIMRAVGGPRRVVRRDLRRLALVIGGLGTIVGVPLGAIVANVVATMVLEDFAGISPDFAVDPIVVGASVAFGLLGARLVSGRAARRVTRAELASSLRDRDAVPFGSRRMHRIAAAMPLGGLLPRISLRSIARRPARAGAITAQFAGAVGAAVLVASLGTSIVDFNTAELASFNWERVVTPDNPVHPFGLDDERPNDQEAALQVYGWVGEWEVEVFGVGPDTAMIDTTVADGVWIDDASTRQATPVVLAQRFAEQEGHAIGDVITADLAAGPVEFEVVGLHGIRSVALFAPVDALADALGTDGYGNRLWLRGDATAETTPGVPTTTTAVDDLFADDAAARDAILGIFAAIGIIVVAIAALGTTSTVAMSLYERRAEFATVQALGGGRRSIAGLVATELTPLAVVGVATGTVAGVAGAAAIMNFFATANAVELGFTVAWIAVPLAGAAAVATVALIAVGAARQVGGRSTATALRAAV
ncbi:MAG: ABC transporter permease [Actinomycetota bacterium]